jgi:hypothetical protein
VRHIDSGVVLQRGTVEYPANASHQNRFGRHRSAIVTDVSDNHGDT